MKVIAINSSPNTDKGTTALVLGPFLEGVCEAGAEVELFYTKQLEINPCQGEFNCWRKTPGHCFQQDDMQMLLPKLAAADILVLAAPLYFDGLPGPLKNLVDRMLPLGEPFFELREGHCRHPRRATVKVRQLVLIANCGFWEVDNFDPLLIHIQAICRNLRLEFAGALLRPHGPALPTMKQMGMPVDDVLAAAKDAGRQLVAMGSITPETLNIVSRELLPREMYIQIANQGFQQALDALEKAAA